MYYGTPRGISGSGPEERAINTMVYTRARNRTRRANGFPFGAWPKKEADVSRQVERARKFRSFGAGWSLKVAADFPDVTFGTTCSSTIALCSSSSNPRRFDVVVTENLFGES